MFKRSNFCHVASNNRNNVKAGLFVYRTTDDLATVTANGYFNDMLIDINLHDLIIHEKIDAIDNTKVQRNLLCVTERTLDNIKTAVVQSQWEENIGDEFVKIDGTSVMTAPLLMRATDDFKCAIAPYWDGVGFFKLNDNNSVTLMASLEYQDSFAPAENNVYNIGSTSNKWKNLYLAGKAFVPVINNGYDIAVPVTNSADTLALKSQVDDAANSGEQLYTTGVWYAKMYSGTTVPTGAEYEGRNYADFSQVDGNNDPIIVVYTYTSGAWTQTTTITPPKNHNGYMTITSKIWDIPEQSGQQGGKVLWSHNQGTFTPYPLIISFESIHVTGDSTVTMPLNPSNDQIVNKSYVDTVSSAFDLFDFKWRDATTSNTRWALANDFDWQTSTTAFNHLVSDYTNISPDTAVYVQLGGDIYFRDSAKDSLTGTYTKAYTNFESLVTIYADTATASTSTTMYDDPDGTTSLGNPVASGTSNSVRIPLLDTIAGTEIRYYLSADGHKICKANQESNIATVYSTIGVAWYYILDAENSRFKLPRVNPDRKKIILEAPTVGATPASLPSGTTSATNLVGKDLALQYAFSGGIAYTHMNDANDSSNVQGQPTEIALVTDFTNSTSYYAGEQYLYFYVGD